MIDISKKLAKSFFITLLIILSSCGSDDVTPSTTKKTTTVKYEEISSLVSVSRATSGCHDGSSLQADFSNREGLASEATIAASRIKEGTMPPIGEDSQITALNANQELKSMLIDYLEAGAPDQ